MEADRKAEAWGDPEQLIDAATQLLDPEGSAALAERMAIAESLRLAHQMVAVDFSVIDRFRRAGTEINYTDLFGSWLHEKIAALVFLTKHILLDVAHAPHSTRDIAFARQDMALYVEILYRVQAIEGLGLLFDFAAMQPPARDPHFWSHVSLHCLHLMAAAAEGHPRVIAFLRERPAARRLLESMMASPDPGVAQAARTLGAEYVQAKGADVAAPPPPYLRIFARYDQGLPYDAPLGLCSRISAHRRIREAVQAVQVDDLADWVVQGSTAAARNALCEAQNALPPKKYAAVLEQVLAHPQATPLRLAAAVVELGALNRRERAAGGEAEMNRILFETAMTPDPDRAGVGRVAVRELLHVDDQPALQLLAEQAPVLAVAEEAVMAFKALRRLLVIEPILGMRRELIPAYRRAHEELVEIQNLMDAIWDSESEELTEAYIARLRRLHATPELQKLAELAERSHKMQGRHLLEYRGDAVRV